MRACVGLCCRGDSFRTLVDVLERHQQAVMLSEQLAPESVRYWLDIFAVSQHADGTTFDRAVEGAFEKVIVSKASAVLLVLSPWDSPQVMTR